VTIGPVQLIALGFDKPDFQGEIIDELERLRGSDMVRVIDALVVYKDADGEVLALKGSQLSKDEAEEFGAVVGGLLGLGAAGEEGMVAGAMGTSSCRRGCRGARRRGCRSRPLVTSQPRSPKRASSSFRCPLRDRLGYRSPRVPRTCARADRGRLRQPAPLPPLCKVSG
jgi:hypothetical protein